MCVIYIPDACSANALLVLEIIRLLFSKVEGDLTRALRRNEDLLRCFFDVSL